MTTIGDLHDDPDCPDCAHRHRHIYSLHCRRCVARMIARDPPIIAAARGEKMRRSMTDAEHQDMLVMIRHERDRDEAETERRAIQHGA